MKEFVICVAITEDGEKKPRYLVNFRTRGMNIVERRLLARRIVQGYRKNVPHVSITYTIANASATAALEGIRIR